MPGHDQLFKDILRAFFPDFLRLVSPRAATELRTETAVFLDGETFTDTPQGSQRHVDLVARCEERAGGQRMVLIHVEVESRFRSAMDERMWRYYLQLSLRHQERVLPVALFLRGGDADVTRRVWEERVAGVTVSRFEYLAFGLSRSSAEAYLARPEILAAGLAALMDPGSWDRPSQRLRCLQGIARAPIDEAKRFLLFNLVETYLQLKGDEMERYAEVMRSQENHAVRAMELTWADRVEVQGARRIVAGQLEHRFGTPRAVLKDWLEELSTLEELQRLSERLLEAKSLDELGFRPTTGG